MNCEIEVTPEMIDAGADILKNFALPDGGEQEWRDAAECVARAAIAAYKAGLAEAGLVIVPRDSQ